MASKCEMVENVSQIFISDSNEPLPPLLDEATQTVKACFKEYKYTLYVTSRRFRATKKFREKFRAKHSCETKSLFLLGMATEE